MNMHLLEQFAQHRKIVLQEEFSMLGIGNNKSLDKAIIYAENFQSNVLQSLGEVVQEYLELTTSATYMGLNFKLENQWFTQKIQLCPSNRKILDIHIVAKNDRSRPKTPSVKDSLFGKELANSPLSEIKKVRIFLQGSTFSSQKKEILQLVIQHFAISYNFFKGHLEKFFALFAKPWNDIYQALKDSLIAAGILDIHPHIYLVEADAEKKQAHYIMNKERARHSLRVIAAKRKKGNDPVALTAHMFDLIEDGNAFAIQTFLSNTTMTYSLIDAKYKSSAPKMVEAEVFLYGGLEVVQTPVLRNGQKGVMMMYAKKYDRILKEFLAKYGAEFIKACEEILKKAYLRWIKNFLPKLKKSLSNLHYLEWTKFFAEMTKVLFEWIKVLGN